MRKFETSKDGAVTIIDDAHGVESRTVLSPAEAEQKRNWLGAMGYPADVAAAPEAAPTPAPKAAKKSTAKKRAKK